MADENEGKEEATTCNNGHRVCMQLRTGPGGRICLQCLSEVISSPSSLVAHKAYAVSQFFQALDDELFRDAFFLNHRYLLVSPLSVSLCACSDEALSKDLTDLILKLCTLDVSNGASILQNFLDHLLQILGSSPIVWTSGQACSLHCLGLLLDFQCKIANGMPCWVSKHKDLISNFAFGLQLPSDAIRGELLFVLFKLLHFQNGVEVLLPFCPGLIHLAVDILMKTEQDEIRINCIAFLTRLAKHDVFDISLGSSSKDHRPMETDIQSKWSLKAIDDGCFIRQFAEALKGPLLSSNVFVQIGTLELLCCACPRSKIDLTNELCVLVEEGISDYIFEILRLSDITEPVVTWCIHALYILSLPEHILIQRFSIGFSSLIRVLDKTVEMTLYPIQCETLNIITKFISSCPGLMPISQIEDLLLVLTKVLNLHATGTFSLPIETFDVACSAFNTVLKLRSYTAMKTSIWELINDTMSKMITSLQERDNAHKIVSSLGVYRQLLICAKNNEELSEAFLVHTCIINLLPAITSMCVNEDITLALLETLSFVLEEASSVQSKEFAKKLAKLSWFSFSFELLACYPTCSIKRNIFLIFSLLIDCLVEEKMGQPVREVLSDLPSDPIDLLFLLAQNGSSNSHLLCCQSAVISILHASCLNNERLASDSAVLDSLEQYIIFVASDGVCRMINQETIMQVVDLYAFLLEGNADVSYLKNAESENVLSEMLVKHNCDIFSSRKLHAVLKWLFCQDGIHEFLVMQIVKFCRYLHHVTNIENFDLEKIDPLANESSSLIYSRMMALIEVMNQEHFGTLVVVSLLNWIVREHDDECKLAVLEFLCRIFSVSFSASCLSHTNAIVVSLCQVYFAATSSAMLSTVNSLVFNILYLSGECFELFEEENLLAITFQAMDMTVGKLKDKSSSANEIVLLFGILTLVLQNGKSESHLSEASRAIISNRNLGSAVENVIKDACSRTTALPQLTEKTGGGQIVISALAFYVVWVKTVYSVSQKNTYFDALFTLDNDYSVDTVTTSKVSLPINLQVRQLCELLYFGSPIVQLMASSSLVEMLSHIQKSTSLNDDSQRKFTFSSDYLQYVLMVLQGFVLHENTMVSKNVAFCIYCILGFDQIGSEQQKALAKSNWYKLIMEELVFSLTIPPSSRHLMTSNEILRAETYVAIALIRLPSASWMRSIFTQQCISSIIDSISSQDFVPEIVVLLKLLMCNGYMQQMQINKLCNLFQEYRNSLYAGHSKELVTKKSAQRMNCIGDNYLSLIVDLVKSLHTDVVARFESCVFVGVNDGEDSRMLLLQILDQFLHESSMYI